MIQSIGLELTPTNDLEVATYTPLDTKRITGRIRFTQKDDSVHHSVLVSSRFDTSHKEVNRPFPGWFVQIVGGKVMLAWGTGHTWRSCIGGPITIGRMHTFTFDLNDHTSTVRVWLDDHDCVMQEKETFRYATPTIIVGALNLRPEFVFNGVVHDLVLGQGIVVVEPIPSSKALDTQTEVVTLESLKVDLKLIHDHINNAQIDIQALEHIDMTITAWRNRGINISSDSIYAQIEHIQTQLEVFLHDTRQQVTQIQSIDREISQKDETIQITSDVFTEYEHTIRGLFGDIAVIDDASNTFEHFRSIGIHIPNSVDIAMNKQRQNIMDTLLAIAGDLKGRVEQTKQIMDEIKE